MLAACAQKRKFTLEPDSLRGLPPWVVCFDSADLAFKGVPLPDDLKLSNGALRELKAIREWAARTNVPAVAEQPPVAEQAAPPPPTPQTAHILRVVPPPCVSPAVFDPAVLAKVAQLKSGPRVDAGM